MALIADPLSRPEAAARIARRPVSWAEGAMRQGVETFLRDRLPAARVVHELTMDRGRVRADVCAVEPERLVTVEIKSAYDGTERLIQQAALFRLATPELWLFCDERHLRDCEILAFLMPTIGYASCGEAELRKANAEARPPEWTIRREAEVFTPDREALASLLWVAELTDGLVRRRIITPPGSKPYSHASLVRKAVEMGDAELLCMVCEQLRARNAEWRADPPISPAPKAGGQP